jgi:hypothetical protein
MVQDVAPAENGLIAGEDRGARAGRLRPASRVRAAVARRGPGVPGSGERADPVLGDGRNDWSSDGAR